MLIILRVAVTARGCVVKNRRAHFPARDRQPTDMSSKSPPRVCDVYGGKGGIGKSTLARAFAWHWADKGDTGLLDAEYQETVARAHRKLKVTAPYRMVGAGADMDVSGLEYLAVDMPPSIEEARPLLEQAHLIVVPVVLREWDMDALIRTLVYDLTGMPRVAVMSRVTHGQRNKQRTVRGVLEGLGIQVIDTVVRERVTAHDRANETGVPVMHPDATGDLVIDAAADLRNASAEVFEIMENM